MTVLIDTGPLIAYVNKRDQYHRWAVRQFNTLKQPFYSCEAVFTETVYQLLSMRTNPDKVLEYVTQGDIKIQPIFSNLDSQKRIRQIISKYGDLPCDFADACLLNIYERSSQPAKIFTLDSDFSIYRTQTGQSISLIIP